MTSVATPEQEPVLTTDVGLSARWSRHRIVAAVASGLMLWSSFPPARWNWLAWVALVPLFWLVTLETKPAKSYLAAYAGGLAFWIPSVEWLRLIDPSAWLGWLVLGVCFALWWPCFLAITRWATTRLRLPLIIVAPIVWVAIEYVRAYFLTGFPWYYLAHSQAEYPYLIQISDVTGSLGVSLLIAVVNAWIVDLATLPLLQHRPHGTYLTLRQVVRLWSVTILLGTTLCYGAYRVSSAKFRDGPSLALLQSNLPQGKKDRDPDRIYAGFRTLVQQAVSTKKRPDLIVWPETSYPYMYVTIDRDVTNDELGRQLKAQGIALTPTEWIERRTIIERELHLWTNELNVPMLVGTALYSHGSKVLDRYNSALLFQPRLAEILSYYKMHLVPFGEFIPLIDKIPLLAALTPYRDKIPSLSFGSKPILLPLGSYKMLPTICFEDTIPQVVNRFFTPESPEPDLIVNLTNDGWFYGSSELDMHLAIAAFRCIEHRIPLARAVNGGLTAVINGNGEVTEALPKNTTDVLSVNVPLDDRTTLYTKWGDWLGITCLAVTIGLLPMGLARQGRRSLTSL